LTASGEILDCSDWVYPKSATAEYFFRAHSLLRRPTGCQPRGLQGGRRERCPARATQPV